MVKMSFDKRLRLRYLFELEFATSTNDKMINQTRMGDEFNCEMNFERIRHRKTKYVTGQISDIDAGDGCC